jgi:hypothetical protein
VSQYYSIRELDSELSELLLLLLLLCASSRLYVSYVEKNRPQILKSKTGQIHLKHQCSTLYSIFTYMYAVNQSTQSSTRQYSINSSQIHLPLALPNHSSATCSILNQAQLAAAVHLYIYRIFWELLIKHLGSIV